MENNKILIGVQFAYAKGSIDIELYVLRDLKLRQLLESIRYGIRKLAAASGPDQKTYRFCCNIFDQCCDETDVDRISGRAYYSRILLTSFNASASCGGINAGARNAFYLDALDTPLCELGFITSSRIVLDAGGRTRLQGKLDTDFIIDAFNPAISKKIVFPEYNISTRQLYQFDDEPVKILAVPTPPVKQDRSLVSMILPALLTMLVLVLVRIWMSSQGSSGYTMVIMSVAMAIAGTITTIISWKHQKKEYQKKLAEWHKQYPDYINRLVRGIRDRQKRDVIKLDTLYPDVEDLIHKDKNGVYTMRSDIYSRAPEDADFLTFRVGRSGDVPSFFPVEGDNQDTVYAPAAFTLTSGPDSDQVRLFLNTETSPDVGDGGISRSSISALPEMLAERYGKLPDAPLLYSLKGKGALGVVDENLGLKLQGVESSNSYYFISRMIFELCYYHAPEDLQFVMFFPEQQAWSEIENTINRYKFMPHFRGLFDDKSQFVFDTASANQVLGALLNIMNNRASGSSAVSPHIIVIVYDEHGLKEHAFAEYLPKVPDEKETEPVNTGLTFVYVTKYKEYLPPYCEDVVSFDRSGRRLTPRSNTADAKNFYFDSLRYSADRLDTLSEHARNVTDAFHFLSAVYYDRIAQNGKVPSSVDMFSLVSGLNPESPNAVVERNWGLAGRRPFASITESLDVPIGRTETGIATLDLHEKGDGPHMLVAGTTGSGKSETIITLLLSLCLKYRPDELNLLLVDMKGGGFTKRIGHLPHVVGTVTDVDGDENGTGAAYMLARFLSAMESEIKRRKLLFNKLYVDSIDGYIQACENIEAHISRKKLTGEAAEAVRKTARESPLSHLILVVDEFTELKRFSSENGDMDFIAEITTIARVGRSLGVHIILISQNIEGAITEDIRVNSRARLCLKVATRQASKDMIGTDLAASPYMPGNGRAYLLVGTGSKFMYFQSGYTGSGIYESLPVEVTCASKYGPYFTFYRSDKDNEELIRQKEQRKANGTDQTQLEVLNDAILSVWNTHKEELTAPHQVFCEPLPRSVIRKDTSAAGRLLDVGICDSPETQSQPPLLLDPYRNHIAVFGGPMSGKTTLIRTLLVRLSEHPAKMPTEDIYIIDFSGGIGKYRELKNVCACFDSSNEENIKRVFKIVEKRLEENTQQLGSESYYNVMQKTPEKCPAHLTLIVENVTAFLADERYAAYQERLQKLCRSGLSKGLTVIITASDMSGISRMLSSFGQKIAFEMPADSYFEIFNAKVTKPMKLPGRGVASTEDGNYEFQCCLPFAPETEEAELQKLIDLDPRDKNPNLLSAFGRELTFGNLADYCDSSALAAIGQNAVMTGLDYEEHLPVTVDLQLNRSIAIYGKRQFGKTNLLWLLLRGIARSHPEANYVFLDDGRKQLEQPCRAMKNSTAGTVFYYTKIDDLMQYMAQKKLASLPSNFATASGIPAARPSIPGRPAAAAPRQNAAVSAPAENAQPENYPYTVFILQHKSLYTSSINVNSLMRTMIPSVIADAERKNCLFIFSEVRKMPDLDAQSVFNTNIHVAFLLDNIGEFVMDKGNKSVFGEMDAKELKSEYAKCSVGDGYCYDIEADKLTKMKFIKADEKGDSHEG